MGRKIMVVTAAYGAEQVRQAGGQRAMLPVIAGAGADGVEIRRELFNSEELLALPALGESACLRATPHPPPCLCPTATSTRTCPAIFLKPTP